MQNVGRTASRLIVAPSLLDCAGGMQAVLPSSPFRGGRQLLQEDSQALDHLSKQELIAQLYHLQQQQGVATSQQGSSRSQPGSVQQPGTSAGGHVEQSKQGIAEGGQQGATGAAAAGTTAVPASSITAASADLTSVPIQEPVIAADASAGALPGLGNTAAAGQVAAVTNSSGSHQDTSSEQPPGQTELQRLLQRRRKQREQVLALIQSQVRLPFSCTNAFQTQHSSRCSGTRCSTDSTSAHHCRLCCTAMQYDTCLLHKLCRQSTVSLQADADMDTIGHSLRPSCFCDGSSCLAAAPGSLHTRSRDAEHAVPLQDEAGSSPQDSTQVPPAAIEQTLPAVVGTMQQAAGQTTVQPVSMHSSPELDAAAAAAATMAAAQQQTEQAHYVSVGHRERSHPHWWEFLKMG